MAFSPLAHPGQDAIHDRRIGDHRDDLHLRPAAGTQKRVHLQDLLQQPRPTRPPLMQEAIFQGVNNPSTHL